MPIGYVHTASASTSPSLRTRADQASKRSSALNHIESYDKTSMTKVNTEKAYQILRNANIDEIKRVLGESADYLGVDPMTIDTSPEATAGRIADFALGMYSIYKSQNQDQGKEEGLDHFESTIRGAIDKGFRDAREILGVLNAMNDGISGDIDETYELVQERLDDWFENARAPIEKIPAESEQEYEVATF